MGTEFSKNIPLRAFSANCDRSGVFELHTDDTAKHINLFIGSRMACVHPDDARAIRDALIAAYPLPQTSAAQAPYDVHPTRCGYGFEVRKRRVEVDYDVVAETDSPENARVLAGLLNEAAAAGKV